MFTVSAWVLLFRLADTVGRPLRKHPFTALIQSAFSTGASRASLAARWPALAPGRKGDMGDCSVADSAEGLAGYQCAVASPRPPSSGLVDAPRRPRETSCNST